MSEPRCELLTEIPGGPCGLPATKRLAVWSEDDSRVTDRMPWVCDEHAAPLLATGNATVVTRVEPSGCQYADTGNGPCGGPTNGLYCWDHKDLRHGGGA